MTARERAFAQWAIGGIAAFFLITRLALVWRFPPFYDEVLYALWAARGSESPADRFVALEVGYEPLHSWLGMVLTWMGASPLTAVRLVSVLAGGVTVVMCGLVARELWGARQGIAAAALAAIVPFFVVHDVIGIIDPLATALVTSSVFLLVRLARRPSLATALLLGITLGGGLLTKRTTYAAIAMVPVSLALLDWSPEGRARRLARWLGGVFLALLVAYALYSIMRLSTLWQAYQSFDVQGSGSAPVRTIDAGLETPGTWIEQNWPAYRRLFSAYLTVPLVFAATVGAGLGLRDRRRETVLVLLWALVPLGAAVLLTKTQYARYLLVVVPPLLVLGAHGIAEALDWLAARQWSARAVRLATAAAIAVLVLPALVFDARVVAAPVTAHYPGFDEIQYVTGGAALKPFEQLADDLRMRADNRPVVVAQGDFSSHYLELAFRSEPNLTLVRASDPKACGALYAVENQVELPRRPEGLEWRRLKTYERPRSGVPTVLYESGVLDDLTFAATPDELRAAIGGSDADFDAFVRERPCVGQWRTAWYAANG